MQYQGVDFDDLKLVRVVKSLENSEINGDQFILHKASDNQSASLRNTLHFTLNTVVQDHAYGTFSDSRYAVIADLKETADQNKIVGLNEVDTFFWQNEKGTSLNKPTLFIPDNDTSSLDKYSAFNTVVYKSDEDAKQNFNNLTQAIKENFQANNLPFHTPSNWGWSGKPSPSTQDFEALEQHLGAAGLVDRHDGSVFSTMESLKSRVQILAEDLSSVKDQQSLTELQVGHESETIAAIYNTQMDAIAHDHELTDYFTKHLGAHIDKLNKLHQEQINLLFPEPQNDSVVQPPPIPQDEAFSNTNISVSEAIRLLKEKEAAPTHMPPPLPQSAQPYTSAVQPPPIPQDQAFSNTNISVDEAIRLLKEKEVAPTHMSPPLPQSAQPYTSVVQPPPTPQDQAFSNTNISVDEAIRLLKEKEVAPPPLPQSAQSTLDTHLEKFAKYSKSDELQFKSALTGIYSDSEFQRIKQYDLDSNKSMMSAMAKLSSVLDIPTNGIDSPFVLLQKINQDPNAKEKIKQEFLKDSELKIGFEQDLTKSLKDANLYQTNLALYTQDVVAIVEQYTSQDINDNSIKSQYKEILNDLNTAFGAIGNDNSLKLQQTNLLLNDVHDLTKEENLLSAGGLTINKPRSVSPGTMVEAISKAQDMTRNHISNFNASPSIQKDATSSKFNDLKLN
jgi:hypothetical protein